MSKQKAKGTAFETQVVRWLRARLEDDRVEREVLHGAYDTGDIKGLYAGDNKGIIECKNYKMYTPSLIEDFRAQTTKERNNAYADFALLVLKTANVGTKSFGRTRVQLTVKDLFLLCTGQTPNISDTWVETDLETICKIIRWEE